MTSLGDVTGRDFYFILFFKSVISDECGGLMLLNIIDSESLLHGEEIRFRDVESVCRTPWGPTERYNLISVVGSSRVFSTDLFIAERLTGPDWDSYYYNVSFKRPDFLRLLSLLAVLFFFFFF